MSRIRIRRRRPAGGAWALAFLCVMLAVYAITIFAKEEKTQPVQTNAAQEEARLSFEGMEIHLVEIGAFADKSTARVEAARYVSRGAAGYILDGSVYRVIASGYADREDAQYVCTRLSEDEGISALVYSLSAPECEISLLAPAGAADALVSAEACLRMAERSLFETADLIDRGTLSQHQAKSILAVLHADLAKAYEKLAKANPNAPFASGILAVMDVLGAECDRLCVLGGYTDLYFSSQIRYNYIAACIRHIQALKSASTA